MTLTTTSQNKLIKQVAGDLNRHEGFREYAYPDPLSPLMKKYPSRDWGFKPAKEILAKLGVPLDRAAKDGAPWTVGYGFTGGTTLDSRMDRITSDRKLEQKILEVDSALSNVLTWYKDASFVTKTVLINLSFNMGIKGLLSFTNTLRFIKDGDFKSAGSNLRKSKYYKQVTSRAEELAVRLETQIILDKYKS